MHETSARPYGWTFLLTSADGSEEIYTLDSLDRLFQLGLRGAVWEAATVARAVAHVARARVAACYNGAVVASGDPYGL